MNFLKSKNNYSDYKYCPLCGTPAKVSDAYCMRCGHSFTQNRLGKKRGIKWRNLLIVVVVIALGYFGLRYMAGQSIIPISLQDALNITMKFAPKK